MRFILAVAEKKEIEVRNVKRAALLERLIKDNYTPFPKKAKGELTLLFRQLLTRCWLRRSCERCRCRGQRR